MKRCVFCNCEHTGECEDVFIFEEDDLENEEATLEERLRLGFNMMR